MVRTLFGDTVNIKSQKDFFAGLMFIIVGAAFAIGAYSYSMGEGARMGPGYFPRLLGVLLAVLGGVVLFKAMTVATPDGEPVGSIAWRPLIFIISANLVFGLCIGGLPHLKIPAIGLVVGVMLVVAIASLAEKGRSVSSVIIGSVIGLVIGSVLVLLAGILVKTGNAAVMAMAETLSSKLFIRLTILVEIVVRLGLLYAAIVSIFRFMPANNEVKGNCVLTVALIAISYWSFIELLNLQFPVWPSFLA
jgi:uncharacterized BrkB/YihY/UPF0761 family membrane protein